MTESDLLKHVFDDAADLLVVLRPNRTVLTGNPSFMGLIAGAREGVDFMSLVPAGAHDRVLRELVRAAAGEVVLVDIPHRTAEGGVQVVEYRFFPTEEGMVGAVGRLRSGNLSDREQLARARAELKAKARMLDEIQLELTQVPFVDPVTGIWNKMQVFERLTAEWSRSERYRNPLTLLLVEVANAERIGRQRGQSTADEVLKAVALRLKNIVRDHDVVGRFSATTFVVVAVQSDFDGALALSGRVRDRLTAEPVVLDDRAHAVSVQIGGATNRSEGVEILEDLFSVAEGALRDAHRTADGVKVAEEVPV